MECLEWLYKDLRRGSRTRSCGKVGEMHGGEPCVGPATQRETCNSTPCPGTWGSLLINHASFMYTKALALAQVPPACYYKYSLGQLIS